MSSKKLMTTESADAADGIKSGLRCVMASVPEQAPAVMILLADLPDLTSHDLGSVFGLPSDNKIMALSSIFALYRMTLLHSPVLP